MPRLFCQVWGDSDAEPFPVKVDGGDTVGELKKLIKTENPNYFKHIDPLNLKLWKWNQSGDADTVKNLDLGSSNPLNPMETVEEIFESDPPRRKCVHIVIKIPAHVRYVSPQPLSYPSDSDEGPDSMVIISPDRMKFIEQYMMDHRFVLIRSPPYSGKSTLGQWIRDSLISRGHRAYYISLAGIQGEDALFNKEHFQRFWQTRIGYTWDEISASEDSMSLSIIIDEAQVIYGNAAPFFWGSLKGLMSDTKKNAFLRIILLASYDPFMIQQISPISFLYTLGLDALRLRRDEFNELVERFVEHRHTIGSPNFEIPQSVQDAIFSLTGGHAGLCRTTLRYLRHNYRDGPAATVTMLRDLTSADFKRNLTKTRAFHWIQNWNPSPTETELLRRILLYCDAESRVRVDPITEPATYNFVRSGILTIVDNKFQFSAPIMRMILINRLFTAPGGTLRSESISFQEFLIRTIERMDPSMLQKSLGLGQTFRLLEMGWYKAATTAVPRHATVSADVGAIFGSVGYLDFYVNGDLNWGIELLREGDRMKQHAKRFIEDGAYAVIPLKEWVIIDFRHHSKAVQDPRPNFLYALYEDDYNIITLKQLGHADQKLVLRGIDM
ncbi:hypothetical protein BGX38DRAFT_1267665 [Terfezia claveryi]|nr:hypothetical protein BGX38DRAFT_1267665 [Terfezia claveryi]